MCYENMLYAFSNIHIRHSNILMTNNGLLCARKLHSIRLFIVLFSEITDGVTASRRFELENLFFFCTGSNYISS